MDVNRSAPFPVDRNSREEDDHFQFCKQNPTPSHPMDLSDIPFEIPVILQSQRKGKNLQNVLGSTAARCLEDNRDVYEQLMLHRVEDDKVAIKSVRNGRFLQVRTAGECVFDSKEPGKKELFTMETDSDFIYFVSCRTGNVLQCGDYAVVKCADQNRNFHEAWRIVEPRNSTSVMSDQGTRASASERSKIILDLARSGTSAEEIEDILALLFDISTPKSH